MLVLPVGTVVAGWHRGRCTGGEAGPQAVGDVRFDCVEVHWSSGEAYVTPVDDDCVGIAILSSKRGGFDAHFDEFPALRERVLGCQRGADIAAGPLRQRVASRA